jgi:hypothetical protein
MEQTMSPTDRAYILDAIDRLIKNRQKLQDALIQAIKSKAKNAEGIAIDPMREAEKEIRLAGKKLGRYHPDAETLPIARWSNCQPDFFVFGHVFKNKLTSARKKEIIEALKTDTQKIIQDLTRVKEAIPSTLKGRPGRRG